MGTTGGERNNIVELHLQRLRHKEPEGETAPFFLAGSPPLLRSRHFFYLIMNVAGPVRASRPIDGGNNYGKLPRSSHGGGDTAAGGVNMYLDIPSFELSLDEFEEYALSRLKVSIIKQSPVSPVICVFVVLPPDQVAVMTLWMVASLTYILKGAAMNEKMMSFFFTVVVMSPTPTCCQNSPLLYAIAQ